MPATSTATHTATHTASPPAGGHGEALTTGRVLVVVAGIYMTQSVIGGMTFHGVPAVMRMEGARLDVVGSVYLLMLPWALKFLWAPLVERWRLPVGGGRRSRQIVLAGQLAAAALLAGLALVDPGAAPAAMFAALALGALITATVDIACDAFTIEQLGARLRGWGNTAQVAGGYLGMMLGGGLFLVLIDAAGWPMAILAMTGLLALLSLPMLLTREPAGAPVADPKHRPSLADALGRPAILWGLAAVLLFQAAMRLSQGMISPFLVDRGFDLALLGVVQGVAGTAASLAGTLAAGLLIRLRGAEGLLRPMSAVQAVLFLGFVAAAVTPGLPVELLVALLLAKALVVGASYVAIYTAMMNWSSPRQAGVDFTLFQCADAAMAAVAGLGGGILAEHLGYRVCFGGAVLLAALAALAMPALLGRARSAEGTTACTQL